ANRSKSVNSSIAEDDAACGYVGHKAEKRIDNSGTWSCGHRSRISDTVSQFAVISSRLDQSQVQSEFIPHFLLLPLFAASTVASSSILSMRRPWASGVL